MNLQKPHFINLHQNIAQTPQDHISINLLGPYNITSQGNSYTLSALCNLTGFPYDHPYQGQKDDSSDPLIFRHHVKIWFPQITLF